MKLIKSKSTQMVPLYCFRSHFLSRRYITIKTPTKATKKSEAKIICPGLNILLFLAQIYANSIH